jgi:outer membrane protein OmpA-like peptidoglycan-associated protein
MNKKNYLFIILLTVTQLISAQTADNKFALGINGITTKYVGDLGSNGITDFTYSEFILGYFSGGLSLNYYLNPSFDLGVNGNYGLYGTYHNTNKKFLSTKFSSSLFGHYKLNNGYIISEDSKWSPFLSLGVGIASYGEAKSYTNTANYDGTDIIVPVGLGLKYQFTDKLAGLYQYNYNFTTKDNHDKLVANDNNDAFGEHFLGLVLSLGQSKDSDKDGVSDKKDLCPNTPIGVKVDEKGCPIDTDKDGVADYLDKCPDTPAGEAVDATGCPVDSDKDGVVDSLDKCPNTPAGVKVDKNGCPVDSDNDGVADYLDKCPNTPARVKVDAKGCPIDTDGDGIADYLDKCPEVKGIAEKDGCPGMTKEEQAAINKALEGIQFKTNSSAIRPLENPILNNVVDVLKKNDKIKNIQVNGHTDSRESEAYNMALSQDRADSVKKYLVKKGIDASRVSTKAFGEGMPISDNKTATGRQKNRRVEFEVTF